MPKKVPDKTEPVQKKSYSRCLTLRVSSVSVSDSSWLENSASYQKHVAESVTLVVQKLYKISAFSCVVTETPPLTLACFQHTPTEEHNPACRLKSQCEGRRLFTFHMISILTSTTQNLVHKNLELVPCDYYCCTESYPVLLGVVVGYSFCPGFNPVVKLLDY